MGKFVECVKRNLADGAFFVIENRNNELVFELSTKDKKYKFTGFYYLKDGEYVKYDMTLQDFINKVEVMSWEKRTETWDQVVNCWFSDLNNGGVFMYFTYNAFGETADCKRIWPGAIPYTEEGQRIQLHFDLIWRKEELTWSNNCGCDHVILDSGDFLLKHYGKYMSGLGIIVPRKSKAVDENKKYIKLFDSLISNEKLNISKHANVNYVQGDFFISKKGTKLFKLNPNGKHYLLRDDWGGAFNDYRGGELPTDNLYYRRASSNGGGSGYDYAVVPVGWRRSLSEDDL